MLHVVIIILFVSSYLDIHNYHEKVSSFGLNSVVTPAGLVLCRIFFVLGNLLSFLYFIRLFENQIFICRSDTQRPWAISMRRLLVK